MELSAQKREIKGNKVKRLRRSGIIPGVVFSRKSSNGKADVLDIQLNKVAFAKAYASAGSSSIFDLIIDGSAKDVLIKDVQLDPLTLDPIHASFYEVDMSEPIEAEIPVVLINEENCEPVKSKTGIIIQLLDEVRVRSLPKYLPKEFEIDVSILKNVEDTLNIAQAISVDPEKIEILESMEEVLVKIDYAEQIESETSEAKDVSTVEVITEAKKDEEKDQEEEEN